MIKVFRHGEGTQTRAEWTDGTRRWTITATGAGHFIDHHFGSVTEAKQFCETKLRQDHTAKFYILLNGVIEETVLDEEFQIAQAGHERLRWNVLSLLIVAALSGLIFVKGAPFESVTTNLCLAGGATVLYLVILWVHNWKTFESVVVIGIMLVLALLLTSAVKRKRQRVVNCEQPTTLALLLAPGGMPLRKVDAPLF